MRKCIWDWRMVYPAAKHFNYNNELAMAENGSKSV